MRKDRDVPIYRNKFIILKLIMICLVVVGMSGCAEFNKLREKALSRASVALQKPYTQTVGGVTTTYNPPSPTGGMNFDINFKKDRPWKPEGNVTLQYAGGPGALSGNPYISISSGSGVSLGQPLVGVNPYLNYPGINFETGLTLGTQGPGAYVQGGYITKDRKVGIIGKETWGYGEKPQSSVGLQKQLGNGVVSVDYYNGGGVGIGYKTPIKIH